ncbi:MAG TPA: hypothetical protein VMW47_11065 [Verrucomicrobiae bacterium]|nr:hypothetical protein [Verrucomicrobiae bacterium]
MTVRVVVATVAARAPRSWGRVKPLPPERASHGAIVEDVAADARDSWHGMADDARLAVQSLRRGWRRRHGHR